MHASAHFVLRACFHASKVPAPVVKPCHEDATAWPRYPHPTDRRSIDAFCSIPIPVKLSIFMVASFFFFFFARRFLRSSGFINGERTTKASLKAGWVRINFPLSDLFDGKKRKKEKREERKRKAGEQEFMLSSLGALGHWPRFKGKAIVPTSRPVNPLINHRRGRLFEAKDKSALGLKASSRNSFSPFPFWNSTECTLVHFLPREEVPFRFLCPRSFVRGFVLIPFLRRFRADTRLE